MTNNINIDMLRIYKNNFYKNGTAFKESEPHEEYKPTPGSEFLRFKPKKGRIDQIRFGLDYINEKCDVNIAIKTFCDEQCHNGDCIWITLSVPNNKHIDWILYDNKISMRYEKFTFCAQLEYKILII